MIPITRCITNNILSLKNFNYIMHLSWQAKYLVKLTCHFLWQAQHWVKFMMIGGARVVVFFTRTYSWWVWKRRVAKLVLE